MNQCVRPFRISINLSLASYKVLLIPAGQDLKIKNKQKFNLQVYSKVHSTKLLTKYEKCITQKISLLSLVSLTSLININSRISSWVFEKIWKGPKGITMCQGTLIIEKNLKLKISWQAPFNVNMWIETVSVWIITVYALYSVHLLYNGNCNTAVQYNEIRFNFKLL